LERNGHQRSGKKDNKAFIMKRLSRERYAKEFRGGAVKLIIIMMMAGG
jgi:hypothetical protein